MAMALTFRACQPDGTRYNARIDDRTWNTYQDVLQDMHDRKMTRTMMLDILDQDHDFHPSLPQLNARMNKWGYAVYASKPRPRLPSGPQHFVQELDLNQDPEKTADSKGSNLLPRAMPVLVNEDSRYSDSPAIATSSASRRVYSPNLREKETVVQADVPQEGRGIPAHSSIQAGQQYSVHVRSSEGPYVAYPHPERTPAIRICRVNTVSSGQISMSSMRELSSRIRENHIVREAGLARTSSASSKITLGSEFSFTRVTGLRMENHPASRTSFTAENMSTDAIMSSMDERLSDTHCEDLLTPGQAELHCRVAEWIGRELAQKKRPDYNRRSTEPVFAMDAVLSNSPFMLAGVQEY